MHIAILRAMLRRVAQIIVSEPKKLTATTAVAGACTLIGDLLEPLAKSTILFLAIFVAVFAGSLFQLVRLQRAAPADSPPDGVSLLLSLSFAGVILTMAMLIWQRYTGAADTGVLAAQVEPIADWQRQFGITHAKLDALEDQVERIEAGVATTKRETSEDPRKELSNIGVQWSTQSFVDAMMAADTRAIDLFYAGGMKADVLHRGSSAILYAIQRNTADPVDALRRAIAARFDVNSRLVDTRPVLDPKAIHHFEGPNVPEGYAAWQGAFAGPMMLWIACRITWYGADATDWQLVDMLLAEGADPGVALDYLAFHRDTLGALDGTGSFTRLERLLEAHR